MFTGILDRGVHLLLSTNNDYGRSGWPFMENSVNYEPRSQTQLRSWYRRPGGLILRHFSKGL